MGRDLGAFTVVGAYSVKSEDVAGDGAEITRELTGARSDPNLHASWHIHRLNAMFCLLCYCLLSLCFLCLFVFGLAFL